MAIYQVLGDVYKTVRRMLSDRCLSVCPLCLSDCLSVTLVYCGQTVGWIRMPLRTDIGLGPGHIALHWDPAPPKWGTAATPLFGLCLLWLTAGWIKMPLGTEVGLGPGDIVLDGDWGPNSPNGKGHSSLPLVGPYLLWTNGRPSQQLLSSCSNGDSPPS